MHTLTVSELRKWLEPFDPEDRVLVGLLNNQLILAIRSKENAEKMDAKQERVGISFPDDWEPDKGDVIVVPKR